MGREFSNVFFRPFILGEEIVGKLAIIDAAHQPIGELHSCRLRVEPALERDGMVVRFIEPEMPFTLQMPEDTERIGIGFGVWTNEGEPVLWCTEPERLTLAGQGLYCESGMRHRGH